MTLADDASLARIEVAIEAEREELCPDAGVLTGYFLLTEWASADGEVYLTESRPRSQSYWRSLGLLAAARLSIEGHILAREAREEEDE